MGKQIVAGLTVLLLLHGVMEGAMPEPDRVVAYKDDPAGELTLRSLPRPRD